MTETIEKEETYQMMTMTEIEERFDGEWILLEDPYLKWARRNCRGKTCFS